MNRVGRATRALAFGIASIAATTAIASDGRFEINQSCVATGCFPGDAAGFPVQTQANESYVLTSDIAVRVGRTSGHSGPISGSMSIPGRESQRMATNGLGK
jgi:hypothetical protein